MVSLPTGLGEVFGGRVSSIRLTLTDGVSLTGRQGV